MAQSKLIPHMVVRDCKAMLDFLTDAFDAKIDNTMLAPDGTRIMHAAITINGAEMFLNDDFPEMIGHSRLLHEGQHPPTTLHLNVEDCDAAMSKAIAAGAMETMPAMDAFWGDRYGKVIDPQGHEWSFASPLDEERTQAATEAWEKQLAEMHSA